MSPSEESAVHDQVQRFIGAPASPPPHQLAERNVLYRDNCASDDSFERPQGGPSYPEYVNVR